MAKRHIDADANGDGWIRKRQATVPEASPAFVLTYLRVALRCPPHVIDSLINNRTLGTWLLFQSTRTLLQTRPRPIQMFHTTAAPRMLSGCTSLHGISNDKVQIGLVYNPPDLEYFAFSVYSQSEQTFMLRCVVCDTLWSIQRSSDREPDSITSMAKRISVFLISHT